MSENPPNDQWIQTKAKQIDAKFVGKGIVQIDPDLIQIANWAPGQCH